MKCTRFVFLLLLLMGSSVLAYADGVPVDPRMDVSDPSCGEISPCTPIEGTSFPFTSNNNGGGFFTFQNVSGTDWTSLLVETGSIPFNVPADTVTCVTNAFLSCQVFDLAGGVTAMYFSGVNSDSDFGPFGILNNSVFTVNLNDLVDGVPNTDPKGSGGWGLGRDFTATANAPSPVPEPATLTLLGIGIAALLSKNKLHSQRRARS
jgi:PEP-CTERM motif